MDEDSELLQLEAILRELAELGYQPALQRVLTADQANDVLVLARKAVPGIEQMSQGGPAAPQ